MIELKSPRFIAFISRHEEMVDYTRLRPNADFVFASFSNLGAAAVQIDARCPEAVVGILLDMHRSAPFAAVLNRKEKCVVPASILATALNLPPITKNPELARDKFEMRRALNGASSFLRTVLVRNAEDLDAVESDMFPCVLKPRFGFNSRAVGLARDKRELGEAFCDQHTRYAKLPKEDGTNSDFVVEELIRGSEHTIETLVKDGKPLFHLVSDKLQMTPPFFIEIGDQMPSRLSVGEQELCRTAAARAIEALGIQNGWTHTEVKLDGSEAIPVECAARMGGGYFEALYREVYGIDRMEMLMKLFLREDLFEPFVKQHAAARRIVVYGKISHRTLKNAETLFDGEKVKLVWPSGIEKISRPLAGPPFDFNNTLCEFLALASDSEEAIASAERVLAKAEVRTIEL